MGPKPKNKTKVREIAQNQGQAQKLWGVSLAVQRAAKLAGCDAFRGARVHRTPLLKWIAAHKQIASDADAAAKDKGSEAELRRERLAVQIERLKFDLEIAKGKYTLTTTCEETWDQNAAIVQAEARLLMDREKYGIFIARVKAQIQHVIDTAVIDPE